MTPGCLKVRIEAVGLKIRCFPLLGLLRWVRDTTPVITLCERTMKDCNQCGKCCQIYADGGLSATDEEIAWWKDHRPDIARYVKDSRIWMDPESGEQLTSCPWLQKAPNENVYSCAIYHDRPEDCRLYPTLISDMIRDDCEMLEKIDLLDLERAQKTLLLN